MSTLLPGKSLQVVCCLILLTENFSLLRQLCLPDLYLFHFAIQGSNAGQSKITELIPTQLSIDSQMDTPLT